MPAIKNTAQFVLTHQHRDINRTAMRLADHLLSLDPKIHAEALFMFHEFGRRRLRHEAVELLVKRWLKARPSDRDWHASVLRRLGQDVIDCIHRQLTRRRLPSHAAALIELLLTICPADDHEAQLIWEISGHPRAGSALREIADLAKKACATSGYDLQNQTF